MAGCPRTVESWHHALKRMHGPHYLVPHAVNDVWDWGIYSVLSNPDLVVVSLSWELGRCGLAGSAQNVARGL